jgi:hypothetical protein
MLNRRANPTARNLGLIVKTAACHHRARRL